MKREDSPDDELFDGPAGIDSFARTLARHRSNWTEILLAALPIGGVLCVHELPVELGDPPVRVEAHVLGPDGCDAATLRTQYGPKPA